MADQFITIGNTPTPPAISADLAAREADDGVVWFHNFQFDAEANAFRWTSSYGNDPNGVGNALSQYCRRDPIGGPDGSGCLEFTKFSGTTELGTHWWRTMCPVVGTGNGRGVDDPAADGDLTVRAWAPTPGGSQAGSASSPLLNLGFYGDISYHAANPGDFDGEEYWLQFRTKADPARADPGQPTGGKLLYQTRIDASFTSQEIVTYHGALNANHPGVNYLRAYGPNGTDPMEQQSTPNYPGPQPNSELGICVLGNVPNNCWAYSGNWDTVCIHNQPGRDGIEEGRYRVYGQHDGDKSYTLIWDQVVPYGFGAGRRFGYNAFIASSYTNGNQGVTTTSEFKLRTTQYIFSKKFIAPVGTLETELGEACLALAPGQSAAFAPGLLHGLISAQLDWQARFLFDPVHNLVHLFGKAANSSNDWRHRIYNLITGAWTVHDFDFNRTGHIYGTIDIDPGTGKIYMCPGAGGNDLWMWNPASFSWTQITADYSPTGNTNPPASLAYHPNLFRRGHGGVVIASANNGNNYGLSIWNERTQALTFISLGISLTNNTSPNTSSHGAYFNHINRVCIGRERHVLVGPDGSGGVAWSDAGTLPIRTMGGATSSGTHATMLQHPGTKRKMMLIGKNNTQAVYHTQDGIGANYVQAANHPFWNILSDNPQTYCSLTNGMKCIWMIGENGGQLQSTLWKPPV